MQPPIKQSGLLFKFSPTDWMTGSIVYQEVNPSGDWRDYLPTPEKQFKDFTFDTMSCTTFSAMNCIETQINWLLKNKKLTLSQELILAEYIDEYGKVNFSDRYIAILSGTTPQGNYFQSVWDAVRKFGLIPEKDLPFGGNSWSEYHNPAVITEAMKLKGQKILGIFDFAYEWLTFIPENFPMIKDHIKHAPVHGAIPFPATHAIELPSVNSIFDTYEPYLKDKGLIPVHYSLKGVVGVKQSQTPAPTYKYFSPAEVAKWKLKPELWAKLDLIRAECGFPFIITSGFRTQAENDALNGSVSDSSHLSGLAVDLSCTDSTRRFKMIDVARKYGIKRLGIGKTFVHMDISTTLPQEVMWHYY